jgi:hypothetical protein
VTPFQRRVLSGLQARGLIPTTEPTTTDGVPTITRGHDEASLRVYLFNDGSIGIGIKPTASEGTSDLASILRDIQA